MSRPEFNITQGDTAPSLRVTPLDEDRNVVPLDAATGVVFRMKTPSGTIKINDKLANADIGAAELVYDWEAGDTDEDGTFDGEFTVTWTDGTKTTFPNFRYIHIKVKEKLA